MDREISIARSRSDSDLLGPRVEQEEIYLVHLELEMNMSSLGLKSVDKVATEDGEDTPSKKKGAEDGIDKDGENRR